MEGIKDLHKAQQHQEDISMVDVGYDPIRGVYEKGSDNAEEKTTPSLMPSTKTGSGDSEGSTPSLGPSPKAAQELAPPRNLLPANFGTGEKDVLGGYTGRTMITVTCQPQSSKKPSPTSSRQPERQRVGRTITQGYPIITI